VIIVLFVLPLDPAISNLIFRASHYCERGQLPANAISAQAANSGEKVKTREP